ncbi:hypothetical protein VTN31DRAFT_6716 [Thermomyces dupontii]|uniref:uncharacterized protein n=1 Tax=Talaromyces thermophilus TaxID=28565 RepID=UPI003742D343
MILGKMTNSLLHVGAIFVAKPGVKHPASSCGQHLNCSLLKVLLDLLRSSTTKDCQKMDLGELKPSCPKSRHRGNVPFPGIHRSSSTENRLKSHVGTNVG